MPSKQVNKQTKQTKYVKEDHQKNVKELGKQIEKIDNEIAELQKSEFNNSQIQRSVAQNYDNLAQSLNEPILPLTQKQNKKVNKTIKVDLTKSEILNQIKQGPTRTKQQIQQEIFELENKQCREDGELEAQINAANSLHTQMILVDAKKKVEQPMDIYKLRRIIEEAEINNKIDQDLIASKQSYGASIPILNVEDLFECDVDVAYKNQQ